MTRIKMCGISRMCDIEVINQLKPEYVGFVFAKKSKRYVSFETAKKLKEALDPGICAVGVFVDAPVEEISMLLNDNIIDIAQLHGDEDEDYIGQLRKCSNHPIIKAFCIKGKEDIAAIEQCSADYVLLDSGAGSGECFDWNILNEIQRPFFLAGGLHADNVGDAIRMLQPYAVDVSSGIETNGVKDEKKMKAFMECCS